MHKFIILAGSNPPYGPYSTEEDAEEDARILRVNYNVESTVMPLEAINWQKVIRQDDRARARNETKKILEELFPNVGSAHRAAEVRSLIANTEGTVGPSYLTDIRRELGIVSRPHRTRGRSGVEYWEWVREYIEDKPHVASRPGRKPKAPATKAKEKEHQQYNQGNTDQIFIPETQVWIYEDQVDEYLQDPMEFEAQGNYIERADKFGTEYAPPSGTPRP